MKINPKSIMNYKKVRLLLATLSILSVMPWEGLATAPFNHASAVGTSISVSAGNLENEAYLTDNDYSTTSEWKNVPSGAILHF